MSALIYSSLIAAAVAAVMLIAGRRGRRFGDHPHCRRCGYDLSGRPPSSTNCPECGHVLTAPRAIVTGRRQRRGGLLVAGLASAVIALVSGTAGLLEIMHSTDWYHYKPDGWLIADASTQSPPDPRAMPELQRRAADPLLSPRRAKVLSTPVFERISRVGPVPKIVT